MKKKKKILILVSSISILLLVAAWGAWHLWGRTYEGRNELERFKNKIELNNSSAKGRREAFINAANSGDPVGQYYLGLLHTHGGMGIPKDYKETIKWWKKAGKNGSIHAQLQLSRAYQRGSYGLSKDAKESSKWNKKVGESYKKAAEAGDPEAQYRLARMYAWKQFGASRDNKAAFKWLNKSAESGNANAQLMLGQCYERGMLKTPKSNYDAKKWYNKSIEQGNIRALDSLAALYAKNEKYEKAIELWKKLAEKKSVWGLFCLMRCFELGFGVAKDENKAAGYLKRMKKRMGRYLTSFLGYAYYYGRNGLFSDKEKGLKYLKEAAKKGNKNAIRILKRLKKRK